MRNALVSIIAPIYKYYPILVHSLQAQTHKNWELILIHDSPNQELYDLIKTINDTRIKYMWTEERYNDWGHSLREIALQHISQESEFVVITNADNYYVPIFIEEMLAGFKDNTVATYCNMLHSHKRWDVIHAGLQCGKIDCGCVMVRKNIVLEFGWKYRDFGADWGFIRDVIQKYGGESFLKVNKILFVHN